MQTSITTLMLDIGGVLLTNGWDRRARERAAEHFGLDHDEMEERHNVTFDTYEQGKLSLDKYLDRIVFYAPRPFTPADFRQFMFAQSAPLPDMIDFFLALKDRHNLRVAAVSNEGRELTEYRVGRFGLSRLIDSFICSCYVHLRKPDEDIFRMALDTMQAKPEEAVYVDDRSMFVEVAAGLGLRSVQHHDLGTTREALASWGLDL